MISGAPCCISQFEGMIYRSVRIAAAAMVICLAAGFCSSAFGQTNVSGRFFGVVLDRDTRTVIPGATATFKNLRTGSLTTARSGNDGQFSYTPLSPDEYDIEVKADNYLPETKRQTLTTMEPTPVEPVPFYLAKQTTGVNPNATPTPTGAPTPTTLATPAPAESESVTLNTSRGGVFDVRAVRSLPLGGTTLTRTFDELAFLVPGVYLPPQPIGNTVGPGVGGGVGTSGQFSVNGLRSRANNFTVDGSDNNDEDIGVRRQGFFTLVPQPIESIQEFQIITLLAPAQYGRNLGAQVNAVSMGGGNTFHGIIYGIGNADFLNARNFFDSAGGNTSTNLLGRRRNGSFVPVNLDNQPVQVANDAGRKDAFSLLQGGFGVGGPIIKNGRHRMFFFASGEGEHLDGTRESHFAVPTVEERGAFRSTSAGSGGSGAEGGFGTCIAVTGAQPCPDPTLTFPSGVPIFPTSPVGNAIFSLFPFPNDPNGVYGRNTYTQALPIDASGVILSGRVDWDLFSYNTNPQTLTVRYNFTNDKRDLTDVGGALFSAIQPKVRTDNISTFLTGNLSTNLSNEFRFSYGRTRLKFEELRDDFLQPISTIGSSQDARFLLNARIINNTTIQACPGSATRCAESQLASLPAVNYVSTGLLTENVIGPVGQVIVGGYSPIGVDVFNFPQNRTNGTYQFADTLHWMFGGMGRHSLAFGTDIRRTSLDSDLPRNSRSLLTFIGGVCTRTDTFCPQTAGFARSLDFVASGAPTGSFQSLVSPGKDASIRLGYYQLDFFAQDEWRPARNFMVNFGLRYELNTTPQEADNKIEDTFSQPLPSYISGLSQFIDGRSKIFDTDHNNFAPRIGVAYSPFPDTAIRGGFGMFYDQILGAVVSQSRNVFPTFTNVNFGGGAFAGNSAVVQGDGTIYSNFSLFNPRDAIFDPVTLRVCNVADVRSGTNSLCSLSRSILLVQPGTLNTINPALTQQQLQAAFSDIFRTFPPGSLFGTTLPTRRLDTPFSYQYSLGIEQRIFGNTFVTVAYVGTMGRHLLRFTTPNQGGNFVTKIAGFTFDPGCQGTPQTQSFCVPVALGAFTRQLPSGQIVSLSQPRPVENAGAISQFETTARSRYDSLQIELRGRFSSRLQYRVNYVFGEVKDDVSDVFDLAGAFALPQNSLTFAGEYAPANFDVRHRFTYSAFLDTPEMRNQSDAVRYLLGGWRVAGTGRYSSGQPFTVNTIVDRNQDGNLTDRLNNRNFITVTDDRRQPLVLDDNFVLSQMLAPSGQDGAEPRNSFRAGSILELDMSFAKRFPVKESQSFEFRTDIFNFIDRANFGIPVRILQFPGFGRAVDTVTPGRRIQFMVRYIF
jgi:hypothetical protein